MNPSDVARARTARLVREGAHKPRLAYTSSVEARAARMEAEARKEIGQSQDLISRAQRLACGEDFCHICGRVTDHFGEHTPEQILAWAKKPGLVQSLLEREV